MADLIQSGNVVINLDTVVRAESYPRHWKAKNGKIVLREQLLNPNEDYEVLTVPALKLYTTGVDSDRSIVQPLIFYFYGEDAAELIRQIAERVNPDKRWMTFG